MQREGCCDAYTVYTMVMVPRPIVLLGLLPILTCLLLCCMPYCGAGEVKTATKLPWCSVLCRVVCIYHKRQWCGTVVLIMEEAFVLPSKVLFEFGSTYLFLKLVFNINSLGCAHIFVKRIFIKENNEFTSVVILSRLQLPCIVQFFSIFGYKRFSSNAVYTFS